MVKGMFKERERGETYRRSFNNIIILTGISLWLAASFCYETRNTCSKIIP